MLDIAPKAPVKPRKIVLKQHLAAINLEKFMGSSYDSDNLFSYQKIVEQDEAEAFPESAYSKLNKWGLAAYYIPEIYGGKLRSFEELLMIFRMLSRRDLTLAIGHGKTYLGAAPVWILGSEPQKLQLAKIIKEENPVALGLTEQEHGADLLSNELQALKINNKYKLYGSKWLINNATRGRALTLFAKTDVRSNARNYSLFLFDKQSVNANSYKHLNKIKTHGIKGADISGISFDGAMISDDSLIGKPGEGLEGILKSLQVSRTLCASLSLGSADTALRTTMHFAITRKLYGNTVFSIPHAKEILVKAFLRILICECLSVTMSRALHVIPEQMSVYSSLVKYFVPTEVETIIQQLAVVLGARHYLREGHDAGIFQKLMRDNAIVSLFDGSTVVNLQNISQQLSSILTKINFDQDLSNENKQNLNNIFSLDQNLSKFNPDNLKISNHGHDLILMSWRETVIEIQRLMDIEGEDKQILSEINAYLQKIKQKIEAIQHQFKNYRKSKLQLSPEIHKVIDDYCAVQNAIVCIQYWLRNRKQMLVCFNDGIWLILCLQLIFNEKNELDDDKLNYMAEVLQMLFDAKQLFSLFPIQIR